MPRSPLLTASAAIRFAALAAASGCARGPGGRPGSTECVQPEPCAAPSGWRAPGIRWTALAVEEDVGGLVAVAAGHDDDVGAERVQRAGELLGVAGAVASPASTRASGRLG